LRGKNIVVLGQGKLVGKPVTHILRSRGLEVSTIDRSSQNSLELIKNADILVSGIGSPAFVKKDILKEGVIVIDAGTSEENGGVVGDVDKDVASVASFVSLTPGGVGPVTVAILLENVLTNASHIYEQ
jgi:5,10-methylene-tetrahydrofolate dehydrogenase/methenyl tetrahydrofolate cyclohydrolase